MGDFTLDLTELNELKNMCEHDVEFVTEILVGASRHMELDQLMMYCHKCAAYSEVPKNWYLGALT